MHVVLTCATHDYTIHVTGMFRSTCMQVLPYSRCGTWNVHISADFMRLKPGSFVHEIFCNNSLLFHAVTSMIPVICRDLGRYGTCMHVTCMDWCIYFMHRICMFHAQNMHISCMKLACMMQVYSMRGTGIFHAWYRYTPCTVQAYSFRGTGICHAYIHACTYRYTPCMIECFCILTVLYLL